MKLKKAIKVAKELGYKWVAVDADKEIYFYEEKPAIPSSAQVWEDAESCMLYSCYEDYTGSKPWTETLREVK